MRAIVGSRAPFVYSGRRVDKRGHFATMAATLWISIERDFPMAEEITNTEGQNVHVVLDEREMRTSFANAYRIHHTTEEVVVDFGFNMVNPNSQASGQPQMLFKVT